MIYASQSTDIILGNPRQFVRAWPPGRVGVPAHIKALLIVNASSENRQPAVSDFTSIELAFQSRLTGAPDEARRQASDTSGRRPRAPAEARRPSAHPHKPAIAAGETRTAGVTRGPRIRASAEDRVIRVPKKKTEGDPTP